MYHKMVFLRRGRQLKMELYIQLRKVQAIKKGYRKRQMYLRDFKVGNHLSKDAKTHN